jgi:hypothetical protein
VYCLSPGDISVAGITGGNYGPVTVSGSGTSNLNITFAKPVSGPDRVTLTIANAQIVPFTGRLDILPGDVNDDGVVNTTDGVLILNNTTPAHAYQVDYDWAAAGLPARDVLQLDKVTAEISDLPMGYLGTAAIGGNVIHLSANAAGHGWFIVAGCGIRQICCDHRVVVLSVHRSHRAGRLAHGRQA